MRGTTYGAVVLALLLPASLVEGQTEQSRPTPDEYTGTTTNLTPGSDNEIRIEVLRWSSESDRKDVLSVLQKASDADGNDQDLDQVQTAGYIWTGGPLGYSLKYAHRVTAADGSEHVTVITDQPLGQFDRNGPWKATGQTVAPEPFTVLELRVNKNGKGQGKMSLGTDFTLNEADQTVGLSDYDGAPVTLKGVQHEPKPYWASAS